MKFDFSTLPYAEWVELIFNREIALEPWREVEVVFQPQDPIALVRHLTRLCGEFSSLRSRFSWGQIDQGVWAVLMFPLETTDYLMQDVTPQETRLECIRSMFDVFDDTVAKIEADVPLETCFFMWWDIVVRGFCWSRLNHWGDDVLVPANAGDIEIHNQLFDTLVKILNLEDSRCQSCALHGLGHLHHPKVAETVQQFIDAHRNDITDEGIQWAMQCRDGTVM